MAMTINTNIVSINAQRNLGLSGNSLSTTMQRLSSGLRVNSAKDDAAGLAIAERMNTQVRGLAVAARNSNDGISLAQTAEGALGKMGDMLQRMRELAVQSSNATNSSADREALQSEVNQLRSEIDRVAKTTTFNGQKILDGSFSGGVFQVGAGAGDNITVGNITNAKASNLGSNDYGRHTLEIAATEMDDLSAIDAGKLSIKVGEETFGLGAIAKANSSQERVGQIVSAINTKTADTGVTAFLSKSATGELSIDLRSKNVESVTETVNGVTTTSVKAVAVALSGFTEAQTGMESVELDSALAPSNGQGYAGFRLNLISEIVAKTDARVTTAVTVDALNANDLGDATTILANAVTALNLANETAYTDDTFSMPVGGTVELSRDSAGAISSDTDLTVGASFIAFAGVFGVPASSFNNDGDDFASGVSSDDVLDTMVAAARNMTAAQIGALANQDQKDFATWAAELPPQTYTTADFAQPSPLDEPYDQANFSFSALMDDVGRLTGGTPVSAEDVFGDKAATWVNADGDDWTALSAADAQAAFKAAQDYLSKHAALGISADNVENQVGMEEMSISTQAGAWAALQTIDSAINQVNSARADLGALQTRFEKAIENIDIQNENITAARGRIVDADFASETANLSRAQILQQAGTAMVAQANQLPQNVLSLLR